MTMRSKVSWEVLKTEILFWSMTLTDIHGTGLYQPKFQDPNPYDDRRSDVEIDREFLKKRVQDAWEYRKKTVDTSSCRIIFGEADFLPGW